MFNYGAVVAPRNQKKKEKKQGEMPGNQLFMGTITLPCVSYCVAFGELLRLFLRPHSLRPQYPSEKVLTSVSRQP